MMKNQRKCKESLQGAIIDVWLGVAKKNEPKAKEIRYKISMILNKSINKE